MLFTCENCKDQEKNFDPIKREILQSAREWGSENFLFKCDDVSCHHHKDNLDSAKLALGVYQPERSKREDLHHKDCIPWIKHNCWHPYDKRHTCEYKEDCDQIVGARMRCSEHCRNAVRDK